MEVPSPVVGSENSILNVSRFVWKTTIRFMQIKASVAWISSARHQHHNAK
jgi:hypothetical protein